MIRGAVIAESLKAGTTISELEMRILRLARFEVPGAVEYQPSTWTMVEFEAPDAVSEPLAKTLADSLVAPGWCADWKTDQEITIVFPGKVLRYRRGDDEGRAAAQNVSGKSYPRRFDHGFGPGRGANRLSMRPTMAQRTMASWVAGNRS